MSYTIPMPVGQDKVALEEVLSMGTNVRLIGLEFSTSDILLRKQGVGLFIYWDKISFTEVFK